VIENERHPPHPQHGIVKYDAGGAILALNDTPERRFSGADWDGVALTFAGVDPNRMRHSALRPLGEGSPWLADIDNHLFRFRDATGPPCLDELTIFVRDLDATSAFYRDVLRLPVLQSTERYASFVTGNLVVTLAADAPVQAGLRRPTGLLIVFHAAPLAHAKEVLERDGVQFTTALRFSTIGGTVRFVDPEGHHFCLYEPSEETLGWGSGAKVKEILGLARR
jgi:catechol 2,3-dioxygenase-like lactoylglutathione lyase family enzyme